MTSAIALKHYNISHNRGLSLDERSAIRKRSSQLVTPPKILIAIIDRDRLLQCPRGGFNDEPRRCSSDVEKGT
jgi:hypothetical protein